MAQLRACEVRQLLHNKFVVVLGDSVQRAVYKDLVLLLQKDSLLSAGQLKAEGEPSFERDVLLAGGGGRRGRGGRGHDPPREVRQFCSGHHLVRFYLLARAFSPYVERVLEELRRGRHPPDLVIVNSCLCDLAGHGPGFRTRYRKDLHSLFGLLDRVLPGSCLLVWTTAMPVAPAASSGRLLPPEQRHRREAARLQDDMLEANFYSAAEACRRGFDVLDLHFHFRHAARHLQPDGVHWDGLAHRHLSQLLLAHVADAWGVDLPCRCPVGRWLRDGASPSGSPGRAGGRRRQHRDGRGDPGERALPGPPSGSMCLRTPRPSSASHAQARRRCPSNGQDISVPSRPACDCRECSRDPPARRVGYTGEAHARRGHHEPRPGPVRRASTHHRSRRSPSPYPSRSPSRSHRHRGRHTDR